MKKKLCVFLFLFLMIPTFVFALDESYWRNGGLDGEVSDTMFLADDIVDTDKYFDGSSFFAGSTVNSNANINGNSFIAGETLKINGTASYGFYAGYSIDINSSVTDLFVAGNSVVLGPDARISRDAYIAGNSVLMSGEISRHVFACGSTIELSNITIDGNVSLSAEKINIKDNVVINGELKYNDDAIITGADTATVGSVTTYSGFEKETTSVGSKIASVLVSIVSAILVAFAFCLVCNGSVNKLAKFDEQIGVKRLLKRLGFGIASFIIIPIACVILFTTIIGMELSVITLVSYLVLIYLGVIVGGYMVGDLIYTKLFKKNSNCYIAMALGITLVTVVSYIPYLGALVSAIVFLTGFGTLVKLVITKEA